MQLTRIPETVPHWLSPLGLAHGGCVHCLSLKHGTLNDPSRTRYTSLHASEIYLLISSLWPATRTYTLLDQILLPISSFKVEVTAAFLVGYIILLAGTSLRWYCYHLLGHNFTSELAVRKDHTLCTRGPYAVVRHPSYTAAFVVVIGDILCLFGEGSWWATCDVDITMFGRIFGGTWTLLTISMVTMCVQRAYKEDSVLSGVFREEWDRWSKETPYALIPYVY